MRKRVLIAPVLVTAAVVLLLFLFRELPRIRPQLDFFERLERLTYDWRVQQAQPATNLLVPDYVGAVFIDDDTLETFNMPTNGGYQYPLPRFLYGQAIKELKDQGARAVAIDTFFLDRNYERDHLSLPVSTNEALPSDEFFARQLRDAGNVFLAVAPKELVPTILLRSPIELFQTNAAGVGFTLIKADSDGVRRRCRAFIDDPVQKRRFWNLGILLAAQRLNLDLTNAVLQPGWVILRGPGTTERRIPLDADGCFYIHWTMPLLSLPSENQYNLSGVCEDAELRSRGFTHPTQFRDKLVVIGSAGSGSNVGDRAPTPLEADTVLCCSIWNIAASVVENKFVWRSSSGVGKTVVGCATNPRPSVEAFGRKRASFGTIFLDSGILGNAPTTYYGPEFTLTGGRHSDGQIRRNGPDSRKSRDLVRCRHGGRRRPKRQLPHRTCGKSRSRRQTSSPIAAGSRPSLSHSSDSRSDGARSSIQRCVEKVRCSPARRLKQD